MSKITVVKVVDNSYEVTVSRAIELGAKFHISGSYAYAGVEYGIVVVTDIITGEELKAARHRFPDICEFINNTLPGDDSDQDVIDSMESGVWVAYKYVNDTSGCNELYYFPIEDFASLISSVS